MTGSAVEFTERRWTLCVVLEAGIEEAWPGELERWRQARGSVPEKSVPVKVWDLLIFGSFFVPLKI